MSQGQVLLSVVIVSYNTRTELQACLVRLTQELPGAEILVIDNASTDDTVAMLERDFPAVRVTPNRRNVGFGPATNHGVHSATGEYVLLLNPDTELQPHVLGPLLDTLRSHPTLAVVGPRLLNADGSIQRSAFQFPTPTTLLREQLRLGRGDYGTRKNRIVITDWLKGAALVGRRELLAAYGPFDEAFFMFAEDIDLCYRLRRDGRRVALVPDVSLLHLGGRSTRQAPTDMTIQFVNSIYLFYQKHYSGARLTQAVVIFQCVAVLKLLTGWMHAAPSPFRSRMADNPSVGIHAWWRVLLLAHPKPSGSRSGLLARPKTPRAVSEQPTTAIDQPKIPREERPSMARGGMALLIAFVVVGIMNYGYAILMSWLLTVEQFGILGVMQAILAIGVMVVGAGFPWALVQVLTRDQRWDRRGAAFRTALVGNAILGSAVAVLLLFAALAGWFKPADQYLGVLLLTAGAILLTSITSVLSGALHGLLRLRAVSLLQPTEVLVKLVAGATAVTLFGTQAAGALVGWLAGAVAVIWLAAYLLRHTPFPAGSTAFNYDVVRRTGPLFVGMFGLTLLSYADIIALKLFADSASAEAFAGQYQVAATLARMPYFAASALFVAVFPYVSAHLHVPDLANSYARLTLKYVALFILPTSLVLIIIPEPVTQLFFSVEYGRSADVLPMVALGSIFLSVGYGFGILLQAASNVRMTSLVLPIGVVIEVGIAALLVPSYGIRGAALGLLAAAMVTVLILGPSVVRRFAIQPTLNGSIRYGVALGLLMAALHILPHGSRVETMVTLLAAGLLYLLSTLALGLFTSSDLSNLMGAFGEKWRHRSERMGRAIDGASFFRRR